MKHGTCCAESALETEEKYFSQGLMWSQMFNMSQILDTAGITPDGAYRVTHIHNIIHGKLDKVPSIHCGSTENGENYLSEIRLCFDKSLALIDCHVTGNTEVVYRSAASKAEIITNCNLHADIVYPKNIQSIDYDINSIKSWLLMQLQRVWDIFHTDSFSSVDYDSRPINSWLRIKSPRVWVDSKNNSSDLYSRILLSYSRK